MFDAGPGALDVDKVSVFVDRVSVTKSSRVCLLQDGSQSCLSTMWCEIVWEWKRCSRGEGYEVKEVGQVVKYCAGWMDMLWDDGGRCFGAGGEEVGSQGFELGDVLGEDKMERFSEGIGTADPFAMNHFLLLVLWCPPSHGGHTLHGRYLIITYSSLMKKSRRQYSFQSTPARKLSRSTSDGIENARIRNSL